MNPPSTVIAPGAISLPTRNPILAGVVSVPPYFLLKVWDYEYSYKRYERNLSLFIIERTLKNFPAETEVFAGLVIVGVPGEEAFRAVFECEKCGCYKGATQAQAANHDKNKCSKIVEMTKLQRDTELLIEDLAERDKVKIDRRMANALVRRNLGDFCGLEYAQTGIAFLPTRTYDQCFADSWVRDAWLHCRKQENAVGKTGSKFFYKFTERMSKMDEDELNTAKGILAMGRL